MTDEQEVQVYAYDEDPSDFVTHMKNAGTAFRKQWGSLIPDDFYKYGKEARREFILGLQAAVDSTIDRLETSADRPSRRGRATKAKVQVD
jgi:hypothetical protein